MDLLETQIYLRYRQRVEENRPELGRLLQPRPCRVRLSELLQRYDAFCFDGYGTLYNRGAFVYPGALRWWQLLRQEGKLVRLVTNAASNLEDVLASEAASRGFDFKPEETISSGGLLMDLVTRLRAFRGERFLREVFYIGRPSGVNVLHQCGITASECPSDPVVAVSSSTATEEMFAQAVSILKRPGAVLLVLNPDAWAPKVDGTRAPVSGVLCERLRRAATGLSDGRPREKPFAVPNLWDACSVEPNLDESHSGEWNARAPQMLETYYLGKPFAAIWARVKTSLPPRARTLMIGDTLGTDVYGAAVAGFDSALIVGRNEPASELAKDEENLGVRPNYYLVPDEED